MMFYLSLVHKNSFPSIPGNNKAPFVFLLYSITLKKKNIQFAILAFKHHRNLKRGAAKRSETSVLYYCTEILNRAPEPLRFLLVVSLPTSEPGTT